jgi:predicted fused transcriptional regulator/phosphomethylpyrimidine kinase
MMQPDLKTLSSDWMRYKAAEEEATTERRKIEDLMVKLLAIPESFESTETAEPQGFVVKISGRIDRKVDGDKVQELAAEFGLTEHLAKLFRWKPEINMAIWKATDETITKPLAAAITAKPGRPSFKIIIKD